MGADPDGGWVTLTVDDGGFTLTVLRLTLTVDDGGVTLTVVRLTLTVDDGVSHVQS
jgi:hypothetical protein